VMAAAWHSCIVTVVCFFIVRSESEARPAIVRANNLWFHTLKGKKWSPIGRLKIRI
jgi:hypothetical protein